VGCKLFGDVCCLHCQGRYTEGRAGSSAKISEPYQSFYSPTNAQDFYFKRNIKIYIKTVPTCFGVITIIRERTKVTLAKLKQHAP
jgi:hypothetical protein